MGERPTYPYDLTGRTCVVTGASAGIGLAVATNLAAMGARVVLACRTEAKGRRARERVARAAGHDRVDLELVDLASRASTLAFAERVTRRHERLHVLVNNAAVITGQRRELGPDGVELTWAVNALAYFRVTELLLGALRRGAPARVVNVASGTAGGLALDDVEFARRPYHRSRAYAQSKQADRMLTWALAERLAGSGVTANATDPGGVHTELRRHVKGLRRLLLLWHGRKWASPAIGADTTTWLAAAPDVADVTGKFFARGRREAPCAFRDPRELDALWALCEAMASRGAPPDADAPPPRAPR